MGRKWTWLLLLAVAFSAGCAANAAEEFAKLKVGMTQAEVRQALGDPRAVRCIRFRGHKRDYLVWEYEMVPEHGPICPTEGASRVITGMLTLGASEIAWTHAKAEPHWVYFLDGMMVYASPGFDCDQDASCQYHPLTAQGTCRP